MLRCDRITFPKKHRRNKTENPIENPVGAKGFRPPKYIASPPKFSSPHNPKLTLILFPLTLSLTYANPAIAQIIPDTTLGAESSILTPLDALHQRIDGGAIRDSNLFHSFQDFSINDRSGAFFSNPAGIENILTRVTGDNPSNIFGTLGVLGNANLFLLNPNGIVFGPNARLDVGGSFFASSAESLVFADGYQFSATNPNAPPLLTVNVPIGLQFGATSGAIVNQSVATNDAGEVRGLQVPSGETLALVGGNVTLDGGNLQPRGGQVELGGLAGAGTVGVNADGSLSFPDGVERADVVLRNAAEVNVRAGGGGSIAVRARNLEMSGGSIFRAGIESGMGAPGVQAGDIVVDATGTTALSEGSLLANLVLEQAIGNGGNVDVTTGSLQVNSGAALSATTRGQGNGGLVTIQAADTVFFDGGDAFSQVASGAVGNAQGIEISARELSVSNGGQLSASTLGQGDVGKISIRATDTVSFDGASSDGVFVSGALSQVEAGAVGNTQGIEITTGTLSVTNRGQLGTNIRGQGNSGRISIVADTVTFNGGDALGQVLATGVGNSGGIDIVADSLFLNNSSDITAQDVAVLLGQDFCSRQRDSQFIVTGRGGIPATPNDMASPMTVWQDWSLTEIAETPTTASISETIVPKSDELLEAQGWYTNGKGQVILTVNPPKANPHSSGRTPVACGSLYNINSLIGWKFGATPVDC